ncbi:MAG: hypothetical protein AABX17_03435 [Nanoarchaeota archaeon]
MQKEDIKTYTIVVLAVLLIVAGVMAFNNQGKEQITVNPDATTDCSTVTSSYLKDACYFELAVKNSASNTCGSVMNIEQKDLCYMEVAVATDTKPTCDLIADKFYTRPRCYGKIAALTTGQI